MPGFGAVNATTAGNVIDATLYISPEDQKAGGYPPELKVTLTIGTINPTEVRRRYALDDPRTGMKIPDYLKPGSPDLTVQEELEWQGSSGQSTMNRPSSIGSWVRTSEPVGWAFQLCRR